MNALPEYLNDVDGATPLHPAEANRKIVNGEVVYGNGKSPTNAGEPCQCPHAFPEEDREGGTIWTCSKERRHCSQPTYAWRGHNAEPCPHAVKTEYYCEECVEEGRLEHLWSPAPDASPAHFFCRHGHWESAERAEELADNLAVGIENAFPGMKDALLAAPRERLAQLLAEAADTRTAVLIRTSWDFTRAAAEVRTAEENLTAALERLRRMAKLEASPIYDIEYAGTTSAARAEELDSLMSQVVTMREKLARLAEDYRA